MKLRFFQEKGLYGLVEDGDKVVPPVHKTPEGAAEEWNYHMNLNAELPTHRKFLNSTLSLEEIKQLYNQLLIMATTTKEKVTVKSVKTNEKWINITTSDAREIGIKKESNPKLTALEIKEGSEVELEISTYEKDGVTKLFGNDIKEPKAGSGNNKGFAPAKPKTNEVALQASCQLYSLSKDIPVEKVLETASKFLTWLNENKQ